GGGRAGGPGPQVGAGPGRRGGRARPGGAGGPRGGLPRHGRGSGMSGPGAPPPVVGVVMGSDSDWPVMAAAADALAEFGVPYEAGVVSAHRMPREMISYGSGGAGPRPRGVLPGRGGGAAPARDAARGA